ncbi:MAG: hypothetical protein WCL00_14225 [Bacteroidota bacterium]
MGKAIMTGMVNVQKFAPGSKSEHNAVVLENDKGCYKLTIAGGNPFHDTELDQLIGKKINASGTLSDYLFVMDQYEVID